MGLRLSTGINRTRFREITGETLEDALNQKSLNKLIFNEFLLLDEEGLRATTQGRQRLDSVLAALLN